jgi:hypothetical protein
MAEGGVVDGASRAVFHPWVDAAPEGPSAEAERGAFARSVGAEPIECGPTECAARIGALCAAHERLSVFVQAGKGVGKSKQIRAWCQAQPARTSIVSVTFRRSLARGVSIKLGPASMSYLDRGLPARINQQTTPRLTILFNSIWKVDADAAFDVVVMDEAVSVLEMAGSELMDEEKRADCCSRLAHLLSRARVVIAADAMFDACSLACLARLSPAPRHVLLVPRGVRDAYTFVWYANEARLQESLSKELAKRCKVAIACMTKATAQKLHDLVRSSFPDMNVLLYTANGTYDMAMHMANIDLLWSDADVLLFSPVITAGCSFERDHFDHMYLFGFCGTCGVRSAIQMTARVRAIRSKTVHVCIERYTVKKESYIEQVGMKPLRTRYEHMMAATDASPAMFLYDYVRFACEKEKMERDMLFFEMFWSYVRRSGCRTKSEFGGAAGRGAASAHAAFVAECMWGFKRVPDLAPMAVYAERLLRDKERISLPPPGVRIREVFARPYRHVTLTHLNRLGVCEQKMDLLDDSAEPAEPLPLEATESWPCFAAATSILSCIAFIQCAPPEIAARITVHTGSKDVLPAYCTMPWWHIDVVQRVIRLACDEYAGWSPDTPYAPATLADMCAQVERFCAVALAMDVVRDESRTIHVLVRPCARTYLFAELVSVAGEDVIGICQDALSTSDTSSHVVRTFLACHLARMPPAYVVLVGTRSGQVTRMKAGPTGRAAVAAACSAAGAPLVAPREQCVVIETKEDIDAMYAQIRDAPVGVVVRGVGWKCADMVFAYIASADFTDEYIHCIYRSIEDAALACTESSSWREWRPAMHELVADGWDASLTEWRRRVIASGGAWHAASARYVKVDANTCCLLFHQPAAAAAAQDWGDEETCDASADWL